MTDQVIPYSFQDMEKAGVSGLCNQVIGPYCMAHDCGLLPEGQPVLVMVRAIPDQVPDLHQVLCQFEVPGFPCGTVKFRDTHVMGRAYGILGKFFR